MNVLYYNKIKTKKMDFILTRTEKDSVGKLKTGNHTENDKISSDISAMTTKVSALNYSIEIKIPDYQIFLYI